MAVLSCNFYSRARVGQQSFTVVLPLETMAPGAPLTYTKGPWPTLYLLHGYTGNRLDWLLRSDIETLATQRGWAVVMPDGGNRFYLDNPDMGEYYGAFVGEELVEVSRRMFPLSLERKDTAIGGLSMGGFGALRNGLYYADTFGSVIALSSALITDEVAAMTPEKGGNAIAPYGFFRHTFGDLTTLLGSDRDPKHLAKTRLVEGNAPRIFMACGTEDFLYPNNVDYDACLNGLGYEHVWWRQPGVHNFEFWNQALPVALDWLAKA